MSDLANLLLPKAKRVFVLGIPLSHSQAHQAKEVNSLLASCQEGWKFKGISKKDNVHLNSNALSGITFILKGKILYNKFCPEIEKEGHELFKTCLMLDVISFKKYIRSSFLSLNRIPSS